MDDAVPEPSVFQRTGAAATLLDQASALLAERLGCSVAEAARHLARLAEFQGLRPDDAARIIVSVFPQLTAPSPGTRAVPDSGETRTGAFDADHHQVTGPGAPPPGALLDVIPGAPAALHPITEQRLERIARMGQLGLAEWNVINNRVLWSCRLYEIFGRDEDEGPATLDDLSGYVVPEDLPLLEHAVETLFVKAEPVDIRLRITTGSNLKYLRVLGEVVQDVDGELLRVYGLFQDVTATENACRQLADIGRQLAEHKRSLETEHELTMQLQQVILPLPEEPIELPGLQVSVRYLPAEDRARVGGDWYDACSLPGGRVLLAVGDVAGHGLTAAAAMARLRHSMAALAVTSPDPAQLLVWLNQMLCHGPETTVATAVVATYEPESRELTWAQAGHLPPLLLRAGVATVLPRPQGVLLGANGAACFGTARILLEPGDRLLLYTDGLVEQRDRPLDQGISELAATLCDLTRADPESLSAVIAGLGPATTGDDTCVLCAYCIGLR